MLKNTTTSYGRVAKFFHWLVAVTVISMFAVGLWMVELDYYSAWYKTVPHYHKSVGIVLALIMIARFVWRLYNPKPQTLETHQNWEEQIARWTHRLFYFIIFSIIVSGYLISTADGRAIEVFNWFEITSLGSLFENQEDIAGNIHLWLAYSLIALAVVHALAALKHHFVDKDTTLKRMI